jgi:hypothetical protein
MLRSLSVVTIALGLVSPAVAKTEAPLAKATRYCVQDTSTGSHIPQKICKTREEWMSEDNFDPLAK